MVSVAAERLDGLGQRAEVERLAWSVAGVPVLAGGVRRRLSTRVRNHETTTAKVNSRGRGGSLHEHAEAVHRRAVVGDRGAPEVLCSEQATQQVVNTGSLYQ